MLAAQCLTVLPGQSIRLETTLGEIVLNVIECAKDSLRIEVFPHHVETCEVTQAKPCHQMPEITTFEVGSILKSLRDAAVPEDPCDPPPCELCVARDIPKTYEARDLTDPLPRPFPTRQQAETALQHLEHLTAILGSVMAHFSGKMPPADQVSRAAALTTAEKFLESWRHGLCYGFTTDRSGPYTCHSPSTASFDSLTTPAATKARSIQSATTIAAHSSRKSGELE